MVKIARQAIEDNGFQNIIKVIPKHSKALTIGLPSMYYLLK